jgi:predicted PurR-regulated permease PerM
MQKLPQRIEITHQTIIFTTFFLIGLYLLYLIKDILVLLFVAILLAMALNPYVTKLEKLKIPRGISITLVYLIFYGIIIAALASIIPPFATQIQSLITQTEIPKSLISSIKVDNINLQDLQVIANQFSSVPKILGIIFSAFSIALVILSISVLGFYLLIERRNLHKYLIGLLGSGRTEHEIEQFIDAIEHQVGSWVRGEALLMFIVGLMTYIGLRLMGINYALPLAILAGFLELLPNIGPTLSAIPAIVLAYFTLSPTMAIAIVAFYVLVQQLENNLIVPMVMNHSIGLNPIATILILMIGLQLGGAIGAILSIPIMLFIKVIFKDWYHHQLIRFKQEVCD